MWVSSYEVTLFFLYSLIFGVLAGAFYDVFRILRIARKPKGESLAKHSFLRFGDTFLCFADDIIYWLILAVAYSIFIYHSMGGRLRLGSIFTAAIGFVLWHFTVGRLVVFLADRIIAFIRCIIRFIVGITLLPLGHALCFVGKKAGAFFGILFGALYHGVAAKHELSLAAKGFRINKYRNKRSKK